MPQVFRLVDPGRIDRILAFDSLPKEMLVGITRGSAAGLPMNWWNYLEVKKTDKDARPFYILDFRTINRDKEKWQEIGNYVRRSTDKNFRLLDNLYDMAKPMAADSYSSLDLEPEDVVVIPVPTEAERIEENIIAKVVENETQTVTAEPERKTMPVVPKKRGRPKRVLTTV